MPEGPDGKTIIIVKKVSGHGGHHGGAWKVAYADFVTAMMALFLVLWLVNSASSPTKEAVASYFRRPGIFEKGSGTPLEVGGSGILQDAFAPPADDDAQVMQHKLIYQSESVGEVGKDTNGAGTSDGESESDAQKKEEQTSEEDFEFIQLKAEIQESLDQRGILLQDLIGQVDIRIDRHGLVIEIMDTPSASMFIPGSARIEPEAEEAIRQIAQSLLKVPNPIDIEGHTDTKPFGEFRKLHYDNWDLSVDRANAARRILLRSGIAETQIERVVGFASQKLKRPSDPLHPSNRRVTITVRFSKIAEEAFKNKEMKKRVPQDVEPLATEETNQQEQELLLEDLYY